MTTDVQGQDTEQIERQGKRNAELIALNGRDTLLLPKKSDSCLVDYAACGDCQREDDRIGQAVYGQARPEVTVCVEEGTNDGAQQARDGRGRQLDAREHALQQGRLGRHCVASHNIERDGDKSERL
eukprot:CAMPEP_0171118206 /NCGR_PEP_ID=MMETSP0766_2-20121228/94210_1 /TAXON_ID=439317 /ORGANISM="Gambierdiscus australes, Strain CAWD 149" /LENGTH=125 /DNA_ID=CAMNT_0011580767 /DNA_START=442 /DNA_END=819 /DNA_ORIENTATION=+